MQVVRTGPDVEKDQRPEVDDREPIAVHRALRPLRDEVVHNGEEAGGQEEADGVMSVPPLHHGVLDTGPDDVGLRREQRHRNRGVVAEMQDSDGEDEGEIEPIGDVNVRLGAPDDCSEEDQQVGDPDHGQPKVGVPFGLGIFLRLCDTEQIAGASDEDEEVVAEHDEPGCEVAGEPGAAGPLHHVERRRNQHVAAESEDDGRRVQRPDTTKRRPRQIEVQDREGKFQRRPEAHRESCDTPDHRGDGRELDGPHVVVRLAVDRERRQVRRAVIIAVDDLEHRGCAGGGEQVGVEGVLRCVCLCRDDDR